MTISLPPFTIRAMRQADVPGINRIFNQPSVSRCILGLPFMSVARSNAFFAGREKRLQTSLVACGPDGTVLGEASLFRETNPRRAFAASLGLMVAEETRRQGIGRALLQALLDLADNWLNLQKLELNVFAGNQPAITLYESLGFEIEANLRQDALQDGKPADGLAMGRVRPGLAVDRSAPPPRPPQAPHTPFTLRAPEPEDLPALAALCSLPGVRFGTTGKPFTAPESLTHLTDPASRVRAIVAVCGTLITGLAALNPGQNRTMHAATLESLMVHDEWQGQGIGRALMQAVLDLADNGLGLRRIGLAVLAEQEHAIRLYQSFGFEVEGKFRADIFRNGGYADSLAMARLR